MLIARALLGLLRNGVFKSILRRDWKSKLKELMNTTPKPSCSSVLLPGRDSLTNN